MAKKPPLRKNVSQTIPNGTILQTRDEFFHNEGTYRKPGYKDKGNYRKAVVIDSNRKNELVVVKLITKGKDIPNSKSRYRPFAETLDNANKRIIIGRKFIYNGESLSKKQVAIIKKDCFTNPITRYKNKKKVRRIKGRK